MAAVCFGCSADSDESDPDAKLQQRIEAAGTCVPGRLLAVVGTDGHSSAVSLFDLEEMKLANASFLTSATPIGPFAGALLGDIRIATRRPCELVLVDVERGHLVVVHVGDGKKPFVLKRIDVSDGEHPCPIDATPLPGTKRAVIRSCEKRAATDKAGDDVLIVDIEQPENRLRIPLAGEASKWAGARVRVGKAVFAHGRLFVPIDIEAKGRSGLASRVLVIEPNAGKIVGKIEAPGKFDDCLSARWIEAQQRIVVACERHGLLWIDPKSHNIVRTFEIAAAKEPCVHSAVKNDCARGDVRGDVVCGAKRCWVAGYVPSSGLEGSGASIDQVTLASGSTVSTATSIGGALGCYGTSGEVPSLYYDPDRERLWASIRKSPVGPANDLSVYDCGKHLDCGSAGYHDSNPGGFRSIGLEGI